MHSIKKGQDCSRRLAMARTIRCTTRPNSVSAAAAAATATAATTTHSDHSQLKYPTLFSPLTLPNGIVLPNRALMGSMHTGLEGHSIPLLFQKYVLGSSSSSSSPSTSSQHQHYGLDAMATYFVERAQGGVGLMVTGGIAPNRAGWTGPFAAKLSTQEEMIYHQVVTNAVHQVAMPLSLVVPVPQSTETTTATKTATTTTPKICMQILHTGRYAYHPFSVSASSTKSPITPFKAKALSKNGIQQTIADFVHCASLAQQAGYDGVEIMASEGYLLSQFLSPRTNLRTDDYGGSLQNRARLPLEILKQTRQACGNDFIIIFRLSLLDLVEGGLQWDECVQVAQWVQAAGATILNTGIGWHEARVPTISTAVPRAAFVQPTAALKATGLMTIPLVATNRINTPQVAEQILVSNASDLVSMARPLLADPDFLNKAKEGRDDEINTCIACNQACLDHAFVGKTASCLVNPRAGHEMDLAKPMRLPPESCQTIHVIGAGPAGCAFAITAAQCGHSVTLYDSHSDIGGQFNMAKRIPGKEEFYETLRYFRTMLHKTGVKVVCNTTLSQKDMQAMTNVDKWIVATGVHPRDLDIPGANHPKVLSYIDVLRHNVPVGHKVAIIGAGGIGFDVAEFLLHHDGKDKTADDINLNEFMLDWGVDPSNLLLETEKQRKDRPDNRHLDSKSAEKVSSHTKRRGIVLLQRKEGKLGKDLGKTTGWIHRATLTKSGAVEMVGGVSYDRIDEDGNLHITYKKSGTKRMLEVDSIVVCAGQLVNNVLELESKGTVELDGKVFTIGGAYQAGELDAKRAIDMGTRLAMLIHKDEYVLGDRKSIQAPSDGAEEKMFRFLQKWMP